MIRSFRCKKTEQVWQGLWSAKFPRGIQDRALRKLRQLDAASAMDDLRNPPGNRLEPLKGERAGQWSIRINEQWRICFRWNRGDAEDVEIVDYHSPFTGDAVMDLLRNPHPGEILRSEFLDEIGMSQNQLAHAVGVPANRIHAIVNGTRAVTADTDLRLCRFFTLSEGYFLRLQNAFDTLEAKRRIADQIAIIRPFRDQAA